MESYNSIIARSLRVETVTKNKDVQWSVTITLYMDFSMVGNVTGNFKTTLYTSPTRMIRTQRKVTAVPDEKGEALVFLSFSVDKVCSSLNPKISLL